MLAVSARPTRESTCAIVITYQPDSGLADRLHKVRMHAADLVIIDNASGDPFKAVLEQASSATPAKLVSNVENAGVATALNQGIKIAIAHGFNWTLLLDQDSCLLPAFLEAAQKAYDEFPDPTQIAVIGTDYDHQFHYKKRRRYPTTGAYREARTVITSGSLISMPILKQIGAFREDLFIDSVDDEYCMRARDHGFSVIETSAFGISHEIGKPKIVRLLGKPRSTSNHSPIRRYYMTRNRLVLAASYLLRDPGWALLLLKSLLREILFVLIFEEQKFSKLKATLLGMLDALTGRMGKLDEKRLLTTANA